MSWEGGTPPRAGYYAEQAEEALELARTAQNAGIQRNAETWAPVYAMLEVGAALERQTLLFREIEAG